MQISTIDPFFKRLLVVTIVVLALLLINAMLSVIIPFLTAFILAYFFNPLVKFLSRRMPRWASILVVYTVISLTIIIVISLLSPMLWEQLQKLWGQVLSAGDYVPAVVDWYNNTLRGTAHHYLKVSLPEMGTATTGTGGENAMLEYVKKNYNVEDAQGVFNGVFSGVFTSSLAVINNAGTVVLIPILMFYFLLSWQERLDNWGNAIPSTSRGKVLEIVKDCDQALMAFVKGQLLVMFLLGVLYAVLLQLIGLDLGLIIGMMAGLASFVPYLGFALGIIAALVAGFFQFGLDPMYLGLIVGAYMIGQAVEGYILQPLLLGDKIGLSPLWVMFAVLAGASLMGIVGMLIALPVAAVINVLFRHTFEWYLASDFYNGKRQLRLFD